MSYEEYNAGKVTVRGTEFRLSTDSNGNWHADANGFSRTSSDTREKLVSTLKVKTSQARIRVQVPFSQVTNMCSVIHGTATGLDGRTGGILIRWDDGSTGKTSKYEDTSHGRYLHKLTPEETEEGTRLVTARDQARRAYDEFIRAHSMDLEKATKAAVEDEAKAQGAEAPAS